MGASAPQLSYVITSHFYVEIDSNIAASFNECSGLSVQIKKEVFSEGVVNAQQRVFLGQTEFSDVTLKRGITNDKIFWEWINQLFK